MYWMRRNWVWLVSGGTFALIAAASAVPALAATLPTCVVGTGNTVSCGTTAVSASSAMTAIQTIAQDIYAVVGTLAFMIYGGRLVLKMVSTNERSSPGTMQSLLWFFGGIVIYLGIGTITGLIQGFVNLL